MLSPQDTLPILDLAACLTIPVAQFVEERLGRPVAGQLVSQDMIPSIRPPGLVKLRTSGPVTHRQVVLRDVLAPNLIVAACWAMFASDRVPEELRHDLATGGEPLDRLLTLHGVAWRAEVLPDENRKTAVREASARVRWARPDTPLLELTRFLLIGEEPLGVLIDEVPRLPLLAASWPV
jgi:hypothetical protein